REEFFLARSLTQSCEILVLVEWEYHTGFPSANWYEVEVWPDAGTSNRYGFHGRRIDDSGPPTVAKIAAVAHQKIIGIELVWSFSCRSRMSSVAPGNKLAPACGSCVTPGRVERVTISWA